MTYPNIVETALNKALLLLNAASANGAQYRLFLADGRQFGALGITPAEKVEAKPRRKRKFPAHTFSKLYNPMLKNMKVGDVLEFPVAPVDGATVADTQGYVTAWCALNWGKGTYVSHADKSKNHVELMRVA